MFNPGKTLGRALVGALFVYGGQNAMKHKSYLAPNVVEPKREALKLNALPATSEQLIQANGIGMIALGSTMALGIAPRLSALGLLGMLVPTTLAGHAFWELEDPQAKNQQMTAFFGNLAAAGGLITIASTK